MHYTLYRIGVNFLNNLFTPPGLSDPTIINKRDTLSTPLQLHRNWSDRDRAETECTTNP